MDSPNLVLGNPLVQTLLSCLSEGVYIVDSSRKVVFWSAGAACIAGYASEEVLGKSCADDLLRHVDSAGTELCQGLCPLAATMQDGRQRTAMVFLHHKEGHRVPVRVCAAPLYDADHKVVGGIETFSDETETTLSAREIASLRAEAGVCPITGVPDRRGAQKYLETAVAEAQAHQDRLGVLLANIDGLRELNAALGHQAGDLVLKMVARTITNALPPLHFVGRWGGGVFLIVLNRLAPVQAAATAERLRMLVHHSGRNLSGNRIQVTLSVGCCTFHSGDTASSLVERTGRLMFQAREAGGNRVTSERPKAGGMRR